MREWLKSTYSGADGCVEVAELSDGWVAVRDSKAPEAGMVVFTKRAFDEFARGVEAGEFEHFRLVPVEPEGAAP